MEQTMKEGMSKIALLMLMASGADIVAPKELKRQAIEALGLKNNSDFAIINDVLKQVKNRDEKLAIINGIILTQLTPSQMLSIHEVISAGVKATLKYLNDHPEERGETPDPETVMKRLIELG